MSEKKPFNKVLNSFDVLFTAFGAMIGWGWVVSTGDWISNAGVIGAIVGFLIGGLMIFFVGLAYSELTTSMPLNGGPLNFSRKALGKNTSFFCSWFMILSYVGVVCFEACSLPTVLQFIFPNFLQGYLYTIAGFDIYATWLAVAIITALFIVIINLFGIKFAAIIQNILTAIIGIVGIILVVSSCFTGSSQNLVNQIFSSGGSLESFKGILAVAAVAPFFLFGFDVIPQVAEEINVPLKKTGRLMLLSIVLAVLFYGLVIFAVGFVMNSTEIHDVIKNDSLLTAEAMKKAFSSDTMANVLIIGGICGIITSWNSFLIGGSRSIATMAEANMIPKVFSKINRKYKTPYIAILLIGLLSVSSVFLGKSMLVWIANASSFACCISYCICSISFLVLRKKFPNMNRPYKVKHYIIVGVIAIGMSGLMSLLYLIPYSGCTFTIQEIIIVLVWLVIGTIFMIIGKIKYKNKFGLYDTECENSSKEDL